MLNSKSGFLLYRRQARKKQWLEFSLPKENRNAHQFHIYCNFHFTILCLFIFKWHIIFGFPCTKWQRKRKDKCVKQNIRWHLFRHFTQYSTIDFPSRFFSWIFLSIWVLVKTIIRHAYASFKSAVEWCVPRFKWLSANNSYEYSRSYRVEFLCLAQTLSNLETESMNMNRNNHFDVPKINQFTQWMFLTFQFTLAVLRFFVFSIQRRQTFLLILRTTRTHTYNLAHIHDFCSADRTLFQFNGKMLSWRHWHEWKTSTPRQYMERKEHQIQMQIICKFNISPLKNYNSFFMT